MRYRILNRNEKNMGLVPHVNKLLFEMAHGDFLFLNGGDDVSLPERVATQMDYFLSDPSVTAVTGSYISIDKDGMDYLREVKSYLDQHPDKVAVLFGFASKSGTAAYNKIISERRIDKVKESLIKLGVPASQIHPVVIKGVDESAKSSKDARRVDVFTVEK